MSACYWKDSKVVVSGGCDTSKEIACSTLALVTLKDLDSESTFFIMRELYLSLLIDPSAHWEKIVAPTELFRASDSAHIYQDKMYVFGGMDERVETNYGVCCLDLSINVVLLGLLNHTFR